MSIAKTYTAQLIGLICEIITVEVDISNGLHAFVVVGLGDRSVDEAKDRIAAAIKNSGFVSPKQKNQKVVISLAPADIKKEGPSFDVAMAIAYLAAAEEITIDPEHTLFLGELSLEGGIRKINGLLPVLCQAKSQGFKTVFIPKDNIEEALLAKDLIIYPASSLTEIIQHIKEEKKIKRLSRKLHKNKRVTQNFMDIKSVRGNVFAKRGLEIAAAGAHNIIMCGPPGTGKTMLARSLNSLLPALSYEESVEVTGIHSVARTLEKGLITHPPFRAPHHTASYPSIVGGGTFPKPGEITLAHRGVLFLDEFPEFDRKVLEALRQPLEDRTITISRSRGVITFPAQCILVASMNPCPCGKGKENGCTCSHASTERYKKQISGPILDRMDIWVQVNKVDYAKLSAHKSDEESSKDIAQRILHARKIQKVRFYKFNIEKTYNSEMGPAEIEKCIKIDEDARLTLSTSSEKLGLSARGFHRVLKVAQTIADLEGSEKIHRTHVLEALQYRQKILS